MAEDVISEPCICILEMLKKQPVGVKAFRPVFISSNIDRFVQYEIYKHDL